MKMKKKKNRATQIEISGKEKMEITGKEIFMNEKQRKKEEQEKQKK